ncbi:hypothetical protein GY45DRAFT_1259994, partial [Cubamyces sp. BRFM 1775]
LHIFPRVFAVGTDKKDYVTCTVDDSPPFDYTEGLEPVPADYQPNLYDKQKASGKSYSRYLKPLESGELHVKARGKEIVFACGYHAVRVHFGLEGNMVILGINDYNQLILQDCPGSNKDKTKAEQMRSFLVPPPLQVPDSRSAHRRQTLAVFASIVCQEHAIVFIDHNRLLRLHVMSLGRHWTSRDLDVDSQVSVDNIKLWDRVWSSNHGPDWIYERAKAEQALDKWRLSVLAGTGPQGGTQQQPSLLDVICASQEVFNGYGQHTAHDLLHSLALWPTYPPSLLCANDALYEQFKTELHRYAMQYVSSVYRLRCLSTPNQLSPLYYNYTSDDNYLNHYLRVFRKCVVRMDREEYNRFIRLGLLDPSHTIGECRSLLLVHVAEPCTSGEPYECDERDLIQVLYTDVPVYQYIEANNPIYTVIRAQRPSGWRYSQATGVRLYCS